jgi:hypothetical protein
MIAFMEGEDQIISETTSGSPPVFDSNSSKSIYEDALKNLSKTFELRIRNSGVSVSNVFMMPWNLELESVKSSYLEHNFAWERRLATLSKDPYSDLYTTNMSSTWESFCRDLKSGIPWYTFGRFDVRIADICLSDAVTG